MSNGRIRSTDPTEQHEDSQMPVKQQVSAETLGKRYAELVRERELPVQGIWARQSARTPQLWIVIAPMELKEERPIHQAVVDLQREFPDSLFEDRVVNPAWIPDFHAEDEVPQDARRI